MAFVVDAEESGFDIFIIGKLVSNIARFQSSGMFFFEILLEMAQYVYHIINLECFERILIKVYILG